MHCPRAVVVGALLASVLLSFGCGGYNNDNVPTLVVTPEMIEKAGEKEAQRLEEYRQIAAEKGLRAPQQAAEGPSVGIGIQKRKQVIEKRKAARKK